VHDLADWQSVHGLRCYDNITRALVTKLACSPQYDNMLASALYSLYA